MHELAQPFPRGAVVGVGIRARGAREAQERVLKESHGAHRLAASMQAAPNIAKVADDARNDTEPPLSATGIDVLISTSGIGCASGS
jgi:hypothetical protein